MKTPRIVHDTAVGTFSCVWVRTKGYRQSVKVVIRLRLVLRLRIRGALAPLLHTSLWPGTRSHIQRSYFGWCIAFGQQELVCMRLQCRHSAPLLRFHGKLN